MSVALVMFVTANIVPEESRSDLKRLSSDIHSSINVLKVQMSELKADITHLKETNDVQKLEIDSLKENNDYLRQSLDSCTNELEECSRNMIRVNLRMTTCKKIIIVLCSIYMLMALTKIVIMVLRIKLGITLPYWVNCLL